MGDGQVQTFSKVRREFGKTEKEEPLIVVSFFLCFLIFCLSSSVFQNLNSPTATVASTAKTRN